MLQVILPDSNADQLPQFFIIPTVAHPFYFLTRHPVTAAQRAKFAEKVHKPPLRGDAINFELNGFNASILVPQTPKTCDELIEVFKFIRYV